MNARLVRIEEARSRALGCCDLLRLALHNAPPVLSRVLLALVERVATLERDLEALANDLRAEESEETK